MKVPSIRIKNIVSLVKNRSIPGNTNLKDIIVGGKVVVPRMEIEAAKLAAKLVDKSKLPNLLAELDESPLVYDAIYELASKVHMSGDKNDIRLLYDMLNSVTAGKRLYPKSFNPKERKLKIEELDTNDSKRAFARQMVINHKLATANVPTLAEMAAAIENAGFKQEGNYNIFRYVRTLDGKNVTTGTKVVLAPNRFASNHLDIIPVDANDLEMRYVMRLLKYSPEGMNFSPTRNTILPHLIFLKMLNQKSSRENAINAIIDYDLYGKVPSVEMLDPLAIGNVLGYSPLITEVLARGHIKHLEGIPMEASNARLNHLNSFLYLLKERYANVDGKKTFIGFEVPPHIERYKDTNFGYPKVFSNVRLDKINPETGENYKLVEYLTDFPTHGFRFNDPDITGKIFLDSWNMPEGPGTLLNLPTSEDYTIPLNIFMSLKKGGNIMKLIPRENKL